MKKILKFVYVFAAFILFTSCETDKSLDPRPILQGGQYVRLDITKTRLYFDDLANAEFGGQLSTPNNDVQKYDLYITRKANGVVLGEYQKLLSVTNFPSQLVITPKMIADIYGITPSELKQGEVYKFLGYATGVDGTVTNYNNLSSTVKSQVGMKQGFKFQTDLENSSAVPGDNYGN